MADDDHGEDAPLVRDRLLLDARAAAILLSISLSSFHALNASGQLPSPVRFGRIVRWNVEELRQ